MNKNSVVVWLLQNLALNTPDHVYEELVMNCSDKEIDMLSKWMSHFMREFDEALLDV